MQDFINWVVVEFTRTFLIDNRWKVFLDGFKTH